jgi:RNA polymerase sigma-70 factor (ECF subfamily)
LLLRRLRFCYPAWVFTESALLDRLRQGEPEAFETLVQEYGGSMRAVALRLLMDEADADDAVQDAFLSAFRSLDTFEGRAELGTWLHRITINAALMKLRTKRRRNETDLEDLLPEFTANGAFSVAQDHWGEGADKPALRAELCRQVRDHIDELPTKFRTPLLLRDIEGLSHKEIGHALDVSENAAKLRVHRARQALRALLQAHTEGQA